jgi:hypothetical protein
MSDQSILRAKAVAAIREGRLSRQRPERLWGGTGDGSQCTVCETPIRPDEIGFELEGSNSGVGRPCNIHSQCLKAWDSVRQHATVRDPNKSSSADAAKQQSDASKNLSE